MDKFKKEKSTKHEFIQIEVKPLIEWNEPNGEGCIVSDRITKEGWKVGYMKRDEPNENNPDSGWRFFKGDEDEDYTSNTDNSHVFALNTICNYDPDIIPHLHSNIGDEFIRIDSNGFELDDGTKPIFMEKQNRN